MSVTFHRNASRLALLLTLTVFAVGSFTSVAAKPPEHAPAHGYYKDKVKQKHKEKKHKEKKHKEKKHKEKYREHEHHEHNAGTVIVPGVLATVPVIAYEPPAKTPPDIAKGRCDRDNAVREAVGTVVGGVIGGVLGSKIGGGDGKAIATVGGVLLGAIIGNRIASNMDEGDKNCTQRALEYAGDKIAVSWQNPDSGQKYTIQPTKSYRTKDGQVCREFLTEVALQNAENKQVTEKACRDAEGVWRSLESAS